jgi:hypothetical protein
LVGGEAKLEAEARDIGVQSGCPAPIDCYNLQRFDDKSRLPMVSSCPCDKGWTLWMTKIVSFIVIVPPK